MPAGTGTSRNPTPAEKKALARVKLRTKVIKEANKAGDKERANAIGSSLGDKKDLSTISKGRTKEMDRKVQSKIGKKFGTQSKEATQRERSRSKNGAKK